MLPAHHSWIGKPYHFHHAEVDEIIQQLGMTGAWGGWKWRAGEVR